MSELDGIKGIVIKFLKETPVLRDDDRALVCKVWEYQLKLLGKNIFSLKANDFFQVYTTDLLTSSDSITRARRKVQETFPELRGLNYEKRQNLFQEEIKKEVAILFEKPVTLKPIYEQISLF
jgi:hypothetical protein